MQENPICRIWRVEVGETETEFVLTEERAMIVQPFIGEKAKDT